MYTRLQVLPIQTNGYKGQESLPYPKRNVSKNAQRLPLVYYDRELRSGKEASKKINKPFVNA